MYQEFVWKLILINFAKLDVKKCTKYFVYYTAVIIYEHSHFRYCGNKCIISMFVFIKFAKFLEGLRCWNSLLMSSCPLPGSIVDRFPRFPV
jgi:hypothetical protein